TLSGVDTLANYQTALRSIQFQNSGTSSLPRAISFLVNDGMQDSNSVSRTVDAAPAVLSLAPTTANPATTSTVQFGLTFSEPVTGVTSGAFTLAESGVSGGSIAVSGSGASYSLTVSGLVGSGTVGVNLTNLNGLTDATSDPVASGFTGSLLTV